MPVGARTRSFYGPLPSTEFTEDGGKTWKHTHGSGPQLLGAQETESESHHKLPNGKWDGGGPFNTVRVQREFPVTPLSWRGTGGFSALGFKAAIGTPMTEVQLPGEYQNNSVAKFKSGHLSSLDADGATAIANVAPTNPNAELGTALAEMHREGIPSLPGVQTWRKRTEIARAAASEFLNAEFGWLPLVHDVTSVADSVRHSRDILKQYQRDSGNNVRREFSFPISNSETVTKSFKAKPTTLVGSTNPGFPGFLNENTGFGSMECTQTIKITSRKWFSGCFTYYLPSSGDSLDNLHRQAAEADKLFGITLTPDVLWELTPWSWAVDWFSNTGDVIHNVTALSSQGLVMRYGYMMREDVIKITHAFGGIRDKTNASWGAIPPSTYIMSSKRRVAANPFGFGVSSDGLSPTQVAIAAALGILLL